jgi:ABC-2 type transport system permease protein
VWVEVVILAVLAVVFLVLARYSLARLEARARREGRLTVRWQ